MFLDNVLSKEITNAIVKEQGDFGIIRQKNYALKNPLLERR